MILDTQPYLVPTITQACMYTLYIVLFVHALRWLLYDEGSNEGGWTLKEREKVDWFLLTITLIVFVFTTVDLVFVIIAQSTFDTDNLIIQQLTIASISVENATLIITDAVLIYRCWLVYQKSLRAVLLPLMLWLASIICIVNSVVNYTLSSFVNAVPYRDRGILFVRIYSSCNFATNFYATSAIVYRLWRVARVNRTRSSILNRVSRIVATTGIPYTSTCLLLAAAAAILETELALYIIFDVLNFSMAGITFNLFLVRAGRLRAEVEMDDADGGTTGDTRGSVLLTTVQLNVPTNEYSLERSVNTQEKEPE